MARSGCGASVHGRGGGRRAAGAKDEGIVRRGAGGGDPRDSLDAARELQSAKGAAADSRELQRARTTTYERRPRARRRRARRRCAGAGSRRARSLLRRSSQVLLCRGRCIERAAATKQNNSGMAMPMPGARVRAAGAGATPCPRKSLARSSVHTSFQQYQMGVHFKRQTLISQRDL